MLAQLRNFAKSWPARIFLVLIVIALGFFGVKNAMNASGMGAVATVDGRPISPRELSRELDIFLRTRAQQGQQALTQPEAIQAGVHLRLLESMIERLAMLRMTERLGVDASDQQVADAIRNIPMVQSEFTGTFSDERYDEFLRNFGYGRAEFEREVRADLSVNMLRQAMTVGVRAPKSFGELLLAYQSERRTVTLAEARAPLAGQIPEPTEEQVQEFYESNRENLQVPEYRAVTLVIAQPSDFVSRATVSEEQLRDEFERRRASLGEPERRSFVQIAAPDQAKAETAAERLASGEDADAVAAALGLQAVRYDAAKADDVADATVARNVFALPANAGAQTVRGQLRPWSAVRLEAVQPAVEPSFESQRARLREEIAADEAADMMDDAVTAFEEARDGGAPAADAARAQGLTVIQIPAMDETGRTPAGEAAEGVADSPELIRTAFETPEGESSDFFPSEDGADVLVAVDRITPQTTRPLEEVREDLINAWKGRELARRLSDIGREVATAVEGGQGFDAAAREHGLTVLVRSRGIDRQSAAQGLPRPLAGAIFSARQGQAVTVMRPDGQAAMVAMVEEITRTDPAEAPEAVEGMRAQVQGSLSESLVEAIGTAAMQRADVKRHERTLAQVFNVPGDDDGQSP